MNEEVKGKIDRKTIKRYKDNPGQWWDDDGIFQYDDWKQFVLYDEKFIGFEIVVNSGRTSNGDAIEKAVIEFFDTYKKEYKMNNPSVKTDILRYLCSSDDPHFSVIEYHGIIRHFALHFYAEEINIIVFYNYTDGYDESALKKAINRFSDKYLQETNYLTK